MFQALNAIVGATEHIYPVVCFCENGDDWELQQFTACAVITTTTMNGTIQYWYRVASAGTA